ncbi:D-alanyl-D-alanine carboxypeptidase/D-alanyl-D-alanine endopeptidase [Roseovarius aestuariivivens]|uniref:D-alanyl-D-alanine carboxypeptidase/D-alanyl-D-alanine endopeptidase n=1 Tax=Roseovarius aestuariivivens TaxID=1888910 RepID=UPI0010810455|nr:D-alanyl-D-alanine carboxypeptidase/D-alanyl-D-alanine-endopeptidase [Roseovarius aestuariivivens]
MTQGYSRRFFLGTALAALASGAHAGAPAVSLRPQLRPNGLGTRRAPALDALLQGAQLGGQVGVAVVDTASGEMLESHGADTGLPPASVTKAVTALYALDALGGAHRFETRLVATGQVRDGVLHGDLVLTGGGDPVLDTNALADMAAQLAASGLREVRGRFFTHGGAVPFTRVLDPGQPDHVGYNPTLSGLTLNFNRVHFEWRRQGQGYSVALDARSDRHRPPVSVARMAVADRRAPVYTYRDEGDHDAWTVARGALGQGGTRWLPVRRPEAYAAEVFAHFARAEGIDLSYDGALAAPPGGRILVRHRSPELTAILRGMLKYSTNLTAELVGLAATKKLVGPPKDLAASAAAMTDWARDSLGMQGALFVDHSGLGEASRMTAGGMARALAQVHGDGQLAPLLKPIPMRDAKGRTQRDHPVRVMAKTGTLYFVSSLAGYATAADGTELAFAILTANLDRRDAVDSRTEERPPGAASFNARAKRLQQQLIERWGIVHGG